MNIDRTERETALYHFWERVATGPDKKNNATDHQDWNDQMRYLSQSGVGMEEALVYLFAEKTTFDEFLNWLDQHGTPADAPEEYEGNVLTLEDLAFWDKNGYIILRNAVPTEQCIVAQEAIWQYLDADPAQPKSWYNIHPGKKGMMLRFFQHLSLHRNRTSARIRKAFRQLYNGTDTYLFVDKVSFNPPETDSHKFSGSPLHWDVSLHLPIPFSLQGLLYLTDVTAEDGAFHCVPGFHKCIDSWLSSLPPDADPREAAKYELNAVPVAANAGDMVIWHQALPHCATPNKGNMPRMVQYITYLPVRSEASTVWK